MWHPQAHAEKALNLTRSTLAGLGLAVHADKTKVVDLREGQEGFEFVGCHFRARIARPTVGAAWRSPLLAAPLAFAAAR